jgi:hypothetical protein
MDLVQIVSLLGRSERDEQVKVMLSTLDVKQPLHRPKRNENVVYVEFPERRMDFCFTLAESLKTYTLDYLEGELVFKAIWFRPNEDDVINKIVLPFNVEVQLTLEEQISRLGVPEDSNHVFNSYRWAMDGLKIYLSYNKEKNNLKEIEYSFYGGNL